jgi:hypothetical protein
MTGLPTQIRYADGTVLHVDPDRPRTPVHSPGDALAAHLRLHTWLSDPTSHAARPTTTSPERRCTPSRNARC